MKIDDFPCKFIDLFSGIGGFHLAFHQLGLEVFASEIDTDAKTYKKFSENITSVVSSGAFNDDIYKVTDVSIIPDFDILRKFHYLAKSKKWLLII